jgi:hypothetical protein
MTDLVGGCFYGVYTVLDAPLGHLLPNARTSRDNLRKIRAIAGEMTLRRSDPKPIAVPASAKLMRPNISHNISHSRPYGPHEVPPGWVCRE